MWEPTRSLPVSSVADGARCYPVIVVVAASGADQRQHDYAASAPVRDKVTLCI